VTEIDAAVALADAAREIDSGRHIDDVLSTIVKVAVDSLPGIDHAGISLIHPGNRFETRAATGELVWQLDALQYETGEGPCLDAIRPGSPAVVTVNQIRHEQRWPKYVPEAVRNGLAAQMGIRLFTSDGVSGGLNLYATATDEIDPTVATMAELLATHAAISLGHARREADLNAALRTREKIGQAVGMVMQKFDVDADVAFSYLARVSQTENVKLREVANRIVDRRWHDLEPEDGSTD
jgi:GAF domain-containing protein